MTTAHSRLAIALIATCLALPATADAKSRAKHPRESGPKVSYANGNSPAEQQRREEQRLLRECKGRPNAGACLGYAR